MLYAHHLTASTREEVHQHVVLPLLPSQLHDTREQHRAIREKYTAATKCTACHITSSGEQDRSTSTDQTSALPPVPSPTTHNWPDAFDVGFGAYFNFTNGSAATNITSRMWFDVGIPAMNIQHSACPPILPYADSAPCRFIFHNDRCALCPFVLYHLQI